MRYQFKKMWLSCLVKHLKLYSETFFKQMEKLFKIYGNQETEIKTAFSDCKATFCWG